MSLVCGDCIYCEKPSAEFAERLGHHLPEIGYCTDQEIYVLTTDTPMKHKCEELPGD